MFIYNCRRTRICWLGSISALNDTMLSKKLPGSSQHNKVFAAANSDGKPIDYFCSPRLNTSSFSLLAAASKK